MLLLVDLAFALAGVVQANTLVAEPVATPLRGQLQEIVLKRPAFRADSKCTFKGYITGYERGWTASDKSSDSESAKAIAGQAVFVTSRTCGTETEPVLYIGEIPNAQENEVLPEGKGMHLFEAVNLSPGDVPSWMYPVAARIDENLKQQDPLAKKLMQEVDAAMVKAYSKN